MLFRAICLLILTCAAITAPCLEVSEQICALQKNDRGEIRVLTSAEVLIKGDAKGTFNSDSQDRVAISDPPFEEVQVPEVESLVSVGRQDGQAGLRSPTEFYFGTSKPSSASAGAFLDDGKGFSSRDGKRYGWDCNGDANVDYASGRRAPGSGGGLGLNHFDRNNKCKEGSTYLPVNWNLEVPNGKYDLEVDFMKSYKAGCKVMGQSAGCGSGKCEVKKKNIKVVNRKITVTGYGHDSGKCHSISRVKVVPLSTEELAARALEAARANKDHCAALAHCLSIRRRPCTAEAAQATETCLSLCGCSDWYGTCIEECRRNPCGAHKGKVGGGK